MTNPDARTAITESSENAHGALCDLLSELDGQAKLGSTKAAIAAKHLRDYFDAREVMRGFGVVGGIDLSALPKSTYTVFGLVEDMEEEALALYPVGDHAGMVA